METVKVQLTGVTPLLMHNGELADAKNPITIQKKEITAKRTKRTEADDDKLERLEWFGSLWRSKVDGRLIIPERVVYALCISAAKKISNGPLAKASVFVPDDAEFTYDGPEDLEELYADERFVYRRALPQRDVRIVRVRPRFPVWGCSFTVDLDEETWDTSKLKGCLVKAGKIVGVGDWRPTFGRFTAQFK